MKASYRVCCGLGYLFATALQALCAEPLKLQSTETQTALLELFTSEGCSRCPAAETWLSGFTDSPRLWKEFVPVAFHVDYWDRAKWKDPFGSKRFSKRQDDYADAWRSDSLRTPDFVWNGIEWMGWYNHETFPKASSNRVGVLSANSEDRHKWTVTFSPTTTDKSGYKVCAALLGFGLRSRVSGGENNGSVLTHDFVALAFAEKSLSKTANGYQGQIELKPRADLSPKRTGIALWVTPAKKLSPVQALGRWLDSTDR